MKHEPHFPPPAAPDPAGSPITRAHEGYASGYGVEHAVVSQWLHTWGKPGFKDFPAWLADQND